MSGGKVSRAEMLLNRLENAKVISEDGKLWFLNAIDPFHDKQSDPVGWPDLETGKSVVRRLKTSMDISKPGTMPAGNWDLHIHAWPMLHKTLTYQKTTTRTGQTLQCGAALPFGGAKFALGGIQAWAVPSGKDLDITLPVVPPSDQTVNMGSLYFGDPFDIGPGRLVSRGFEVHNTTSELYKQGSVVAYKLMANAPDRIGWVITDMGGASTPFTGTPVQTPPSNTAEAMSLFGSQQWEAKDGCYVVSTFSDLENPAFTNQPLVPVVMNSVIQDKSGVSGTGNVLIPSPTTQPAANTPCSMPDGRVHRIHQGGCIFRGLSEQTTLTIDAVHIWESFPDFRNLEIVTMAKSSPDFDFNVQRLYSEVMKDIPVGVPVWENGLGDWFVDAISTAAQFVGPLLGGTLGKVVKGFGDMGQRHLNQNQNQVQNTGNQWKQPMPQLPAKPANQAAAGAKPKKKKKKKKPSNTAAKK